MVGLPFRSAGTTWCLPAGPCREGDSYRGDVARVMAVMLRIYGGDCDDGVS